MSGNITWRVDDVGTLRFSFVSLLGALTDPSTVSLKVRTPSGTITTYTYGGGTVTKDSTGRYSKAITFDEAGIWAWRISATGTITKSEEGTVRVVGSDYGL